MCLQSPPTAIREFFGRQGVTRLTGLSHRIRFAPPLVIEESDLHNAIKIIEQSLRDLDEVSLFVFHTTQHTSSHFQLEFIPGDDSSGVPSMDK